MAKPIKPTPYSDGRIQTLNNMGAMSPAIDIITAKYLAFLNQSDSSVKALEIGAAYGAITKIALQSSLVSLVACDIEGDHLKILEDEAQECCTNQTHRLETYAGDFPNDFQISTKFDAILMARVAHFFSPTKLVASIEMLHKILNPHGCVYLVGITPYVMRFSSFISEYEQRIENNDVWPGYVTNLQNYANISYTPENIYKGLENKKFHFLDSQVLRKNFELAGFNVMFAAEFPLGYNSTEWELDGRENVGIIACKGSSSIISDQLDL